MEDVYADPAGKFGILYNGQKYILELNGETYFIELKNPLEVLNRAEITINKEGIDKETLAEKVKEFVK